jgi:hypothetical protein
MTTSTSPFRFLSSRTPGQYSVWRGDQPIGYVTKVVHRIYDRGVTKTVTAGWTPSTIDRADLAIETTREAAAKALWAFYQKHRNNPHRGFADADPGALANRPKP